jgi:hypothetical protein
MDPRKEYIAITGLVNISTGNSNLDGTTGLMEQHLLEKPVELL